MKGALSVEVLKRIYFSLPSNRLPHILNGYIIFNPSPRHLCFKSVALFSELLDAFKMHLLLRVQTLVLLWV